MKIINNVILVVLGLVLVIGAHAAWTKQNARIESFQARTVFNSAGAATAVHVSASVIALVVNDADPTQSKGAGDSLTVRFDLIGAPVASTNYTAAGKTVNGVQLAALIREVALAEATRQGISP